MLTSLVLPQQRTPWRHKQVRPTSACSPDVGSLTPYVVELQEQCRAICCQLENHLLFSHIANFRAVS